MRSFYDSHRETIDRFAFLTLIIAFVYVFFKYLFAYVSPFFMGLAIALVMEPLIGLLVKRARFSRGWAAIVCLLLFLLAVGSLGTFIISKLYNQIGAFMDAAPSFIDETSRKLDNINEWLSAWTDSMPDSLYVEFPDIKDALLAGLTTLFGDGVKTRSWRIVSNMPDFFIGLVLMLVSAFFFMKDRPIIFNAVKERCPAWLAAHLRLMKRGLSRAIGGYFRAQFMLMSIVGTISIGGLLILRNPYALLIGLIIALLDFLPIFGSGTLLLPWIAGALITGQYRLAIGLLVLYGVITITRQVLEPKILGEQIGVHPLATLMSVYIGYKIFGFFGIMIGPSLVIIFQAIRAAEKEV